MTWADVKSLLKKEDRCLEHHLRERGESETAFKSRVTSFYAEIIMEHLVNHYASELVTPATSTFFNDSDMEAVVNSPLLSILERASLPSLPKLASFSSLPFQNSSLTEDSVTKSISEAHAANDADDPDFLITTPSSIVDKHSPSSTSPLSINTKNPESASRHPYSFKRTINNPKKKHILIVTHGKLSNLSYSEY